MITVLGVKEVLDIPENNNMKGKKINILRPRDSKKPFIVSVRSEDDIVRSNNKNANIALVFAALIALAGILIMIFMR